MDDMNSYPKMSEKKLKNTPRWVSFSLSATHSVSLSLGWQRCFLGFTGGRGRFGRRQHVTCFLCSFFFFLQSIIFCLVENKEEKEERVLCVVVFICDAGTQQCNAQPVYFRCFQHTLVQEENSHTCHVPMQCIQQQRLCPHPLWLDQLDVWRL